MSPLEEEIHALIDAQGPMSVADFMNICLTHPEYGYYTTGTPVGGRASAQRSGGDFITAPEVSQMFGELIGVWCMEVWQALGRPDPFNLVEIGPGRGTLMADLLRVAKAMPGFLPAAKISLVEVSPTLAEQQSLTLSKHNAHIQWVRSISDLPDMPTILVGNEFLDALPFQQWIKTAEGWMERCITSADNALRFTTRAGTLRDELLPPDHEEQTLGAIFETSPQREGFVHSLADRIYKHQGAALLIDYGHLQTGFGDTFQALRDHAYVDVLSDPGTADLTSHVDFEALVKQAIEAGCIAPEPTSQGAFLLSLGLLERAGALGADQTQFVRDKLTAAVNRLAGADQMGNLFKVMAFGAPASLGERWPGFE